MTTPMAPTDGKGAYVRKESSFRDFVTADGSSGFAAAAGRYHLYVSLACPWASRTLLVRKYKGLEDAISVDVVDWLMGSEGWTFTDKKRGCTLDTINGKTRIRDIYLSLDPEYSGRFTVPCLWDKEKKTIVSNESSEIVRMLNSEFNAFCATEEQKKLDFYPENLRADIDAVNEWIYPKLNNGVYRCGFAKAQEAYDEGVADVFNSMDKVEEILSTKRYLCGATFTEADIRLFVTLIRFDPVYVQHFKCSKKRVIDYPHMFAYVREIYQMTGTTDTVDFEHIRKHYMQSTPMLSVNPTGIVHICPDYDLSIPHGRENM